MRGSKITCAIAAATLGVLGGCGGGNERQDADEPKGNYSVGVDASFAESQSLAKQERFDVRVRNTDDKTIPNVAVSIDSFSYRSERKDLADPERPNWIVDSAPAGADTAYVGTWSLGKLKAGEERTFSWRVTPVRPGDHTVKYRVAAGLDGKAKAQLDGGGTPEGSIAVSVSDKPSTATVDPDTGEIRRDNNSEPDQ